MGKFEKREKCQYCEARMIAINRSKRFCSIKCRVYWNREKDKVKEEPINSSKTTKDFNKGELFKLIRDGKI